MKDEIISYREMCDKENIQTLQRGMNYRLNPNYTVILMYLNIKIKKMNALYAIMYYKLLKYRFKLSFYAK